MFRNRNLVPHVGSEITRVGELEVSDTGEEAVFDLLLAHETVGFILLDIFLFVRSDEGYVVVGRDMARKVVGRGWEGEGRVPGEVAFGADKLGDDGGSFEGG